MRLFILPLLLLSTSPVFSQDNSGNGDGKYYHNHRKPLTNSYNKFTDENVGTVAFLGGSITYNGGWRDSVMHYLQKRFPETEFTFIAAGIPSMGTTPAAFRLERDVLSKGKVDLLFEEAAVNDFTNGRTDLEQQRAMEGIIRSLRESNPRVDIINMHFVDPPKMEDYNNNRIPAVIQNHEMVNLYYRVPSINLAREVTERINAGEFDWKKDFKDLHPSPFGQSVYARSIIAFLEYEWKNLSPVSNEEELPEPLNRYNYQNGKLVDIGQATGNWVHDPKWTPVDKGGRQNYVNVPMLIGTPGTGELKFIFEGNLVGIAVAAGPDAGIIEYKIDRSDWKEQDLFTKWSAGLHLPWYYTLAADLDEGSHTLRIRVKNEHNEKSTGNYCRIRYFYITE